MDEMGLPVLLSRWQAAFKQATDFDTWGQPVEAISIYQRLSKDLHHHASSEQNMFTENQKKTLEKIAVCLDSRERSLQLQRPGQVPGISLNDVKKLESTLKNILCSNRNDFPLDVSAAQLQQLLDKRATFEKPNDEKQSKEGSGSLLPKPLPITGMTMLTVHIDKIGLKDSSQFINPFITVSVKDANGRDMTASQDTPVAAEKQDSFIIFNINVHIQKAIESLPPGFAVFFELKHYKPRKGTVSTRCWTFLEKDEIRDGDLALELYKKPTDCRRKSVSLLTIKPLYLHLRLQLCR